MKNIARFAALLLLAWAGSAQAGLIALTASLDGASQVPNNPSPASATADLLLDDMSNELSWTIGEISPFFSSAVNFAHFHLAEPGMNGPVELWICTNGGGPAGTSVCGTAGGVFASGTATISTTQKDNLLAGNWYINIHTQAYPGGEIRGQVERVPLPSTLALFCLGLLAIRRRLIHCK